MTETSQYLFCTFLEKKMFIKYYTEGVVKRNIKNTFIETNLDFTKTLTECRNCIILR